MLLRSNHLDTLFHDGLAVGGVGPKGWYFSATQNRYYRYCHSVRRYIIGSEAVFPHFTTPCLHITTSAGAVGEAADIVGELLGLHVAQSPFDIWVLVRRMVLRFADTDELWAVGRAFFSALSPDNEGLEQRVTVFGAARVGWVPFFASPGRANLAVHPRPSKARTMV